MKVYVLTEPTTDMDEVECTVMAVVSNERIAKLWDILDADNSYEEFELDETILPLLDRRTKAYRIAKEALEEMRLK